MGEATASTTVLPTSRLSRSDKQTKEPCCHSNHSFYQSSLRSRRNAQLSTIKYLQKVGIFILLISTRPDVTVQECAPKYSLLKDSTSHTSTACLDPVAGVTQVEITDAEKKEIVDGHNKRRANTNPPALQMPKMIWDDEVAMFAEKWAMQCKWEHDDGMSRTIPGEMYLGQNLFKTTGHLNYETGMTSWWDEVNHYEFGTEDKMQPSDKATGHYTQMAWESSYLLGCGASKCSNGESFFVCNYGPGGNIQGFKKPYKDGEKGKGCKKSSDGLCDCGDLKCNLGKVDYTTCTCNCEMYYTGEDPNKEYAVPEFTRKGDCSLNCKGTKDTYYCGNGFNKCDETFIFLHCPHFCKACPYAEGEISKQNNVNGTEINMDSTAVKVDSTAVKVDSTAVNMDSTAVNMDSTAVNLDSTAESGSSRIYSNWFQTVFCLVTMLKSYTSRM